MKPQPSTTSRGAPVKKVWIVSEIFNQYNGTGPNFLTNIDFGTAGLTADKEEAEMSCELYFLAYNGDLTHIDNSSQSGGGRIHPAIPPQFRITQLGRGGTESDAVVWSAKATPKTGVTLTQVKSFATSRATVRGVLFRCSRMTATTSHQTDGETHNTQTARLASTNSARRKSKRSTTKSE